MDMMVNCQKIDTIDAMHLEYGVSGDRSEEAAEDEIVYSCTIARKPMRNRAGRDRRMIACVVARARTRVSVSQKALCIFAEASSSSCEPPEGLSDVEG